MGYRNEADRLCSVYEATGRLEDYVIADKAFEDQIAGSNYTSADLLSFAYLQDLHASFFLKKARTLYEKLIAEEENNRSDAYYGAHAQLIVLLSKMDKSHVSIARYKKMIADEPGNYRAYKLLETAYFWARQYDDAWLTLEAALKLEPDNTGLLSEAGYVLKALGRYDEAIAYYDKSLAMPGSDASSLYGKACLYMDTGRYPEALKAWQDVLDWLETNGFGESAEWPKAEIERIKKLI